MSAESEPRFSCFRLCTSGSVGVSPRRRGMGAGQVWRMPGHGEGALSLPLLCQGLRKEIPVSLYHLLRGPSQAAPDTHTPSSCRGSLPVACDTEGRVRRAGPLHTRHWNVPRSPAQAPVSLTQGQACP